MCNLDRISPNNIHKNHNIVDFNNNKSLVENEVSFHWWTAEETSMHSHNFYEFFIITDGKTYHELNGKTEILTNRTFCMVRPEDCHQFRMAENTPAIHMNISVTKDRLEKICDAINISLNSLSAEENSYIKLSNDDFAFFKNRSLTIGLFDSEKRDEKIAIICALIAQCVSIVQQSKLKKELNYPNWFVVLLEKINSPESLSCNANDVYKMGGFSSSVMIDYFKKYTGKTVNGYLRDMKCEVACKLLKDTSLTVLDISYALGYESSSHFNRIFKEYTGQTPSQYRKGL